MRGDLGAAAPGLGPRAEVVVDCLPGTTLAQVDGLGLADGPPTQVSVSGQRLDPLTAVVGRPPLLDGAVLVLSPPGVHHRRGGPGGGHLLELVVVAGPDAATVHPLTGGRLLCGRGVDCDVVVRDPRMSRAHCELVVQSDGVRVRDLGSTNGTTVLDRPGPPGSGAAPVASDGRRLALGEECVLGASLVTLRAVGATSPGATTTATGEGTVLLRRSPRVRLPEPAPVVRLPAPGRASRVTGFPVLAVVLPALAAGGLALWTGSAVYLLLAALGPLLVAGGWFTSRRDARRDGVLGRHEHARTCAALRDRARRAAEALALARAASLPDADTLLRHAARHGHRVWERDPGDDDALRVRLGRAEDGGHRGGAPPGPSTASLRPQVVLLDHESAEEPVTTVADLVSVDLATGALGVVETGDVSVARFVVGQLVTLLPAGRLHVVAVLGTAARERWHWLGLLPHVLGGPGHPRPSPPDGSPSAVARWLAELVEHRSAPPAAGNRRDRTAPLVLVVVDDPVGDLSAGELAWLPEAAAVGVHVVVVVPRPAALPRGCGTTAVPSAPDGVELVVSLVADGSSVRCVADRVGPWWSERISRHLAPLRVTSPQEPADLPDRVPLAGLLGTGSAETLQRWSTSTVGLPVPLGVARDGPVVVDLVSAGPHALVAGTTGSGKSELLRAWLLAIALCHPPEHVALLLVDYKGGATFEDLSGLPHTVGLLTDLDGGATTRVLHSLRAEVRRRERLLAGAGARDLDQLQQAGGRTLPRLLVVVDEFRVLAEDAPDVLAEFVRLAATGRSLGLHLVLATQRPAGVVSADIRANTGLRIALRVQDPGESRDVVERPDAAWLPHDRPGRAVVVGAGIDQTLQAAWVGEAGVAKPSVTVLAATGSHGPVTSPAGVPSASGAGGSRSAAVEVVAQVRAAVSASGRRDASSPWLPPLPVRLMRSDLPTDPGAVGGHDRHGSGRDQVGTPGAAGPGLALGLSDLPWLQARAVLVWDPMADGPALVVGGPRSGRSSTLQVMAEAADRLGVPVVRLHGGDPDGDHAVDLLTTLTEDRAARAGAVPVLQVLLLVDDCDALLDPGADPEAADLLVRVLRTAHRAGAGVALAGGRATVVSRLAAAARVRLVHRTTDGADAVLAGVPAGTRSGKDAPGRCLVLGLPTRAAGPDEEPAVVEAQVLLPEQEVGSPAGHLAPRPPTWLARPLAAHVDVRALTAPSDPGLPVGVLSPDGEPWLLQVGEDPLLAVVGPAGSGRSTALATIRHQARAAGVPVCRLEELGPDLGRDPGTPALGHPPAARLLLVDDLERCGPAAVQAVEAWLGGGTGPLAGHLVPGATVVVAGLTEWFAAEFRGVPAAVRRQGSGVVLRAGRTDVRDVLGGREQVRQRTYLPGRGILLQRGRARRIQLAVAGTAPGPAGPVVATA